MFLKVCLANCTRGSFAGMKNVCQHLEQTPMYVCTVLCHKCTGTRSGGTWFVGWVGDFYRENWVVGAQGEL